MEIKINDCKVTDPSQLRGCIPDDVVDFLEEWFSPLDYVMGHTSGSTGTPQPLRLYKCDMMASAAITNRYMGVTEHSSLLLSLSVRYIAGMMMVVRALQAGAMLYVVPPSSHPLAAWSRPVDVAAMVPMQVEATLRDSDGAARLSLVSQLLVGGAPLSPQLAGRLAALPVQVYVTYGMTETVSHVALRRIGEDFYTAVGDVRFSLDNRGCLVIDAPHLGGRRFVTNDVVNLVDERRFIWLGRYDNVIMSGGLKFHAESIEQKMASLLHERYYIVPAPDDLLGQRIVLVIEGTPYDAERMQALRQRLSTVLSRYEMPRTICFMPRFVETYSGKVKRVLPR